MGRGNFGERENGTVVSGKIPGCYEEVEGMELFLAGVVFRDDLHAA